MNFICYREADTKCKSDIKTPLEDVVILIWVIQDALKNKFSTLKRAK